MAPSFKANHRVVVKNTIVLYIRMVITMIITLYSSRLILNILGVNDFGTYNIVGGVATILVFLNWTMASATQRFFAFAIGRNDRVRLSNVFLMSMNIHIGIAMLILILSESIGLWFLNVQINIPAEKIVAANWVYQFTILSMLVTILQVPYNAMVMAHERMTVYAAIDIVRAALKLLIIIFLIYISYDKLISYAILLFLVDIVITIIYRIYCRMKFSESHFYLFWDSSIFKEMINYSSWNFLGTFVGIGYTRGIDVLLNIFFGVIINAASGIASQVSGVTNYLSVNLLTAINPQIVKSYSTGNFDDMFKLLFLGLKLSAYLSLLVALPVILQTERLLSWWLKVVPEHAVIFVQLMIVLLFVQNFSRCMTPVAQAIGNMKFFQLTNLVFIFSIPVIYVMLKLGASAETIYSSMIVSEFLTFILRIIVIKRLINLDIKMFVHKVLLNILLVATLSFLCPYLGYKYIEANAIIEFIIITSLSIVSVAVSVYFVGLSTLEREIVRIKMERIKIRLFPQNK